MLTSREVTLIARARATRIELSIATQHLIHVYVVLPGGITLDV